MSSAGFWPGDAANGPLFYSYAYPEPDGFAEASVRPADARYEKALGEFVLPYSAVGEGGDDALVAFLESTYAAAADCGGWEALESPPPAEARPRPF